MEFQPIKTEADYRAALKEIEAVMAAELDTPGGELEPLGNACRGLRERAMRRVIARQGTAREFFQRGRKYARRARTGKSLPKSRLVTFEDPADVRARLIADLRADREFAAEYLNFAAKKGDPQVYVAALKDLVESIGTTRVAKVAKLRREYLQRALSPESFAFRHTLRS